MVLRRKNLLFLQKILTQFVKTLRKSVRKFLGKPVDLEIIKRFLEAGNAAPTWNHTRDWSYIILRTEEEKAYAFELYSTAFSAHSLARYLV